MHYLIDGYNLIFRLLKHDKAEIKQGRDAAILDLNRKAGLLGMDVTLIFDAMQQEGPHHRTHFDAVEIIYSAHGESADEYIMHQIASTQFPKQCIVVTSDQRLARLVKSCSVKTESVEAFMQKLDRAFYNKMKKVGVQEEDSSSKSLFSVAKSQMARWLAIFEREVEMMDRKDKKKG